jgi:phosphoglycolate phosphatase-like HAD superfamily hydrolase
VPLRIAFDLDGVLADMDAELIRQAEHLFGGSMIDRPPATNAGSGRASGAPADVLAAAKAGSPARQPRGGGEAGSPARQPRGGPEAAESTVEPAADLEPPLVKLNLTSKQQRRLWKHVESIENFWETLQEIEPGTVKRLARLADDRRWEIMFLTKRPRSAGATCQLQTQRWLVARGFPLPSVYVVQGSRGRIAAALALDVVIDDRPENCLDIVVDSKARAILVWRDDEKNLPAAAKRLGIAVVRTVRECLDVLEEIDAPPPEQPGLMDRVMRLLGLKETAGVP